MKRLLLTTALVAFTAAPVMAQTSPEAPAADVGNQDMTMQNASGIYLEPTGQTTIYGSEFLGKNVYVTADETHPRTTDGIPDGWENVATVDDLLMTRDGEIRGILVDVGGFLGMGARTVAVDMNALDIVYDRDGDDFHVVFTSNREDLEGAPEYDRMADIEGRRDTWDMDGGAQVGTAMDPAMQSATADDALTAEREGYVPVVPGEISVDDLKAAEVFDITDERIAGVSDVLVTADGDVTDIIVDVGGFLGLGAKAVAIAYDDVELFRSEGSDGLRVHLPMTREQLEELPDYDG